MRQDQLQRIQDAVATYQRLKELFHEFQQNCTRTGKKVPGLVVGNEDDVDLGFAIFDQVIWGRFSMVVDPNGAVCGVIAFEKMEGPEKATPFWRLYFNQDGRAGEALPLDASEYDAPVNTAEPHMNILQDMVIKFLEA